MALFNIFLICILPSIASLSQALAVISPHKRVTQDTSNGIFIIWSYNTKTDSITTPVVCTLQQTSWDYIKTTEVSELLNMTVTKYYFNMPAVIGSTYKVRLHADPKVLVVENFTVSANWSNISPPPSSAVSITTKVVTLTASRPSAPSEPTSTASTAGLMAISTGEQTSSTTAYPNQSSGFTLGGKVAVGLITALVGSGIIAGLIIARYRRRNRGTSDSLLRDLPTPEEFREFVPGRVRDGWKTQLYEMSPRPM
ncbi:unnamed protein product [Penicillium glandicola]